MGLHGLDGDEQFRSHLLVRVAARDQPHDLLLAVGQPVQLVIVDRSAERAVGRRSVLEGGQHETGGFAVTISIPGGEEVARRTFNPHIGVEGGLSVLGTSGIVEPMSQQAILDTIQLEMNQAALRAKDHRRLILAPGNYGLDYLHETYPQFATIPVVKTSNFIGDTLDMAAAAHFEQVLLVVNPR